MAQLYAACRQSGSLVIRTVQLNQSVQSQLDGIFQAQEAAFMQGINSEVDFDGGWTPESDELLVARGLPEAQILFSAATQNAVSLTPLNVGNFENEGIKALFTIVGAGATQRLLLQNFGPQQIFSTRMSFLHDQNTFRALSEPAFCLDTKLVAVVDAAGDTKFKSFNMVRRVFELGGLFQQATNAELASFCAHANLDVSDPAAFTQDADEGIRKSVHAVMALDILNTYSVPDIQSRAAAISFPINVSGGKIQMPTTRREAKELLCFLLDRVYRGPIGQQLLITNSNRPI
jgi:hypothetical protein